MSSDLSSSTANSKISENLVSIQAIRLKCRNIIDREAQLIQSRSSKLKAKQNIAIQVPSRQRQSQLQSMFTHSITDNYQNSLTEFSQNQPQQGQQEYEAYEQGSVSLAYSSGQTAQNNNRKTLRQYMSKSEEVQILQKTEPERSSSTERVLSLKGCNNNNNNSQLQSCERTHNALLANRSSISKNNTSTSNSNIKSSSNNRSTAASQIYSKDSLSCSMASNFKKSGENISELNYSKIQKSVQKPSTNTSRSQSKNVNQLRERFSKIKENYYQNSQIISQCKKHITDRQQQQTVMMKNSPVYHPDRHKIFSRDAGEQREQQSIQYAADSLNSLNMNSISIMNLSRQELIKQEISRIRNNSFCSESSVNRELKVMNKPELVDLLLNEIEENEKHKHLLAQKTQELDSMRASLINTQTMLSEKQMQMTVLIQTERRNLLRIEQMQSEKVDSSQNRQGSRNQRHNKSDENSRTGSDLTFQSEGGFLKQQQQHQKSPLSSSKVSKQQQHNPNSGSSTSASNIKRSQAYCIQLENHMKQYIENTNQAQIQFKKTLHSLRAVNHNLKHECQILRSELGKSKFDYEQIIRMLSESQNDVRRLENAIQNGRVVMKELEGQFLALKEQNDQLYEKLNKESVEQTHNVHYFEECIKELSSEYNRFKQQINDVKQQIIADLQVKVNGNDSNFDVNEEQQCATFEGESLKELYGNLSARFHKLFNQNQKYQKQMSSIQTKHSEQFLSAKEIFEEQVNQVSIKNRKIIQTLTQNKRHLEAENQQLKKIQFQLLEQYEKERSHKQKLKNQMKDIGQKIIFLENTYKKELAMNGKIKAELQNFWKMNQMSTETSKNSILNESVSNHGSIQPHHQLTRNSSNKIHIMRDVLSKKNKSAQSGKVQQSQSSVFSKDKIDLSQQSLSLTDNVTYSFNQQNKDTWNQRSGNYPPLLESPIDSQSSAAGSNLYFKVSNILGKKSQNCENMQTNKSLTKAGQNIALKEKSNARQPLSSSKFKKNKENIY